MKRLVGSAFGLGLVPFAPGTFGTLAGVGIALLPGDVAIAGAAAAVFVLGLMLADARDPGWFVLDEVAAFPLVVLGMPRPWWALALGFLAFRLFDIWKPWPIRRVERLPGRFGVMADDVVAAAYAHVVLRMVGLL